MDYSAKSVAELKTICKDHKIKGISGKNKKQLIDMINGTNTSRESPFIEDTITKMLEICKLPECLDIIKLKEMLNDYMSILRIKFYIDRNRAPYIEDEFSEYFTAECSGGVIIGSGSCAMDVLTKDNNGIDAMCVVMTGKQSNEKSLIQNFSVSGGDLDTLFNNGKDKEAVKLYMDQYSKKLNEIKAERKLKDM